MRHQGWSERGEDFSSEKEGCQRQEPEHVAVEVLVATDVCLRGADGKGIAPLGLPLLVNYDLPTRKVWGIPMLQTPPDLRWKCRWGEEGGMVQWAPGAEPSSPILTSQYSSPIFLPNNPPRNHRGSAAQVWVSLSGTWVGRQLPTLK